MDDQGPNISATATDWAAEGAKFGAASSSLTDENPPQVKDWATEARKFGATVTTIDQDNKAPSAHSIDWSQEGQKFGASVSSVDEETAPGIPAVPLPPELAPNPKQQKHTLTAKEEPHPSLAAQIADLAEGTAKVSALGALPITAVLDPVGTAAGVGAYMAVKSGASYVATKFGAPPDVARAIGSVAAFGSGAGILLGRRGWDSFFDGIDTHNAAAQTALEQEQAGGRATQAATSILGTDSLPVNINGQMYTVEPAEPPAPGTSLSGTPQKLSRPQYKVVDPSGKTVVSGNGPTVSDYLGRNGAKAASSDPVVTSDVLDHKYSEIVRERAEAQSAVDTAKNTGKRDIYAESVVKDADAQLSDIQKQRAQFGASGTRLPSGQVPAAADSAESVVAPAIEPGAEFDTPNGRQTVQGIKGTRLRVVGQDGKTGTYRIADFLKTATPVAKQEAPLGTDNAGNPLTAVQPDVSQQSAGTAPAASEAGGAGRNTAGGLPGQADSQPGAGESQSAAGSEGDGVRRVTGSADLDLIPAGEKQAEEMAATKTVAPFNIVRYAPNTRSRETAEKFFDESGTEEGIPQSRGEVESLNGWPRGEYEGRHVEAVKAEMSDLMLHPDKIPPGVSPVSGQPGKSWNQAMLPLFRDVQNTEEGILPSERALMITSGGQLQAIDAWGKAGFPQDFQFDHTQISQEPYWSVTGKMFVLSANGLEEVPNNKWPGRLYFAEHGATKYNPPKAATATGQTSEQDGASSTATEPQAVSNSSHGEPQAGQPTDISRTAASESSLGAEPGEVSATPAQPLEIPDALPTGAPGEPSAVAPSGREDIPDANVGAEQGIPDGVSTGQVSDQGAASSEQLYAEALRDYQRQRESLRRQIALADRSLSATDIEKVTERVLERRGLREPRLEQFAQQTAQAAQTVKPWTAPGGWPPSRGGWMNRDEVEHARDYYRGHPILGRASQFLFDFMNEVDDNSDGWPYWNVASHAAKRLEELIQHPETATEDGLRAAISNIRAFYTRHGEKAGMKFPAIDLKAQGKKPVTPQVPTGVAGAAPLGMVPKEDGKAKENPLYTREGEPVFKSGAGRWMSFDPTSGKWFELEQAQLRTVQSQYLKGSLTETPPIDALIPPEAGGTGKWTHLGEPIAAAAETATIEAPANEPAAQPEAEHSFGGLDRQPLEEQLPEAGESTGEPERITPVSRAGGRERQPRAGAGTERGEELDRGAGTVSGVVGQPAEPEVTFPPRGTNPTSTSHDGDYRIPDGRVVSGSPEKRAHVNLDAIAKLREIQAENRPATVEEQRILAGYVGWGAVPQLFAGLTPDWKDLQSQLKNLVSEQEFTEAQRSTTNAHYTGDNVVDAMWRAMMHIGAAPGMSWLEPAIGTGNFFGRQPDSLLDGARRMGVEKDALTGAIARLLYPNSGIDIMPFERAELPENYFDAAISNVPFGNFGVHDPSMKKFLTTSIHNYFFAKAMTMVRPGGVVGFVTSRYTLDAYAPAATEFRKWMAERADFLGAVRLPSGAFRQNAGTDVITDIIFLRKRIPGREGEANRLGHEWIESHPKQIDTGYYQKIGIPVNQYYHANPGQILGTEGIGRGQFTANEYDVRGTLTDEALDAALRNLGENQFLSYRPSTATRTRAIRELNAPTEQSKLGGLFFDDKGQLFRKTSKGSAEPVDISGQNKVRIKGQLLIRNELAKLMDAERNPAATDEDIAKARKRLNAAYDHYVKMHGFLSSRANTAVMAGDPDAPLLVGLERRYNQGNKAAGKQPSAEKAPILSRRMFQPDKPITSVSDPKDALYVSLNETGRIDWERMSSLSGKSAEQLQQDLAGLAYLDPRTNLWQTADEYLSGSVRKKLKEARAIAKLEPDKWEDNVRALEGAQPEDIPPGEIRAALGITWVPLDTYGQFVQDVLGLDKPAKVTYIAGNWNLDIPWDAKRKSAAAEKWNTARAGAAKLLTDALNMKRTKIYDESKEGSTLNVDETRAAQSKQDELQKHFNDWLFSDPARGDEMTRLYNELNNDLRLWQADGSHLTLPGMVRDSAIVRTGDLEPHQKNAVWRVIKQKNVLLAHAVGTGKTFEAIAAGMELKRLGLVQRPMYVVPNDTLGGWQMQFNALYPQARTLVFSEKDLEKSKRQRIMAQIATGDWDAVVIPHSSFQFLATGDDIFQAHFDKLAADLDEQLAEAAGAGMDSRQIKRMEKAKERLLKSLEDKRKEEKKDQTVTWEQLGIDQLFVDESHEYKKLGFATKQNNIAGIDPNGNQKTFDLLMKVRYTQTHGRGVVFLTGTPITNTMGEMFNLMKYLIEPELEARGLAKFDEWSANYGRTVPVFEPKPEGGGYQMKARFAKFVNLPELIQLFRSFADVVTSDMVKLPIPEIIGGGRRAVITNMTPEQTEYLTQHLQPRAAGIRRDPRGSMPDNMLAVYTDAGKMAMDIRMVNPGAPGDPEGRLAQSAEQIHKFWEESAKERGTQAVFADVGKPASAGGSPDFSFYEALIERLVKLGIPRGEIATIYEAKNKVQRRQLFEKFNDGKIRVMLGSTKKMGQGVNIQERLYAEHHIDIPPRPDQLEQREGRILRQGNKNPAVHILYYMTKGTLDEKKFADVVRKGKFIASAMQGKTTVREAEDIGGMIPSLEMFQAMTSGDPRVLRKMEVDAELDRLSSVRSGWKNQLWHARGELSQAPTIIRSMQRQIEQIRKAITKRDETGRVFTIGGKALQGDGITEEVSNRFYAAADRLRPVKNQDAMVKFRESIPEPAQIGTAYGLPVYVNAGFGASYLIGDDDVAHANIGDPEEKKGTFARIQNAVTGLDAKIPQHERVIETQTKNVAEYQKFIETPWPYETDYEKLVQEQEELVKALGGDKGDDAALAAEAGQDIPDSKVEAEDRSPQEEEEGEEGRPEETEGGSTEPKSTPRLSSEAGQAPMLTDLLVKLANIGKGAEGEEPTGQRHYSYQTALKRQFLPGKNLEEVKAANRDVYDAAVLAGSSTSISHAVAHLAFPLIKKALDASGTGVTIEQLFSAYQESRLRAISWQYAGWAEQVQQMDEDEIRDSAYKTFPNGQSTLLAMLNELDDKLADLDISQTAAQMVSTAQWSDLGGLATEAFTQAADAVVETMDDEQYGRMLYLIANEPNVRKADALYGDLVEKEVHESHERHEGVFTELLGDLGRYFPLLAKGEETNRMSAGKAQPYRAPRNMNNQHAMGMSSTGYTTELPEVVKWLSTSMRASGKANLLKIMDATGWSAPEPRNWDGTFVGPNDVVYTGEKETKSPNRTIIANGSVTGAPASNIVMPEFLNEALKPILDKSNPSEEDIVRAARGLNMLSTKLLPFELAYHSNGMFGTLYGNTPFFSGDTAIKKALTLPIIKAFYLRFQMAATNPSTPENAAKLIRIAKIGALPARSGSVTRSREVAETTGATLERASWGPVLFGPNGIDARSRIMMYDLWMSAKGTHDGSDRDLADFINQIGQYTPEFQGAIEKWLKRIQLGPFATAGMTRLVNGFHAATGSGPMPPHGSRMWRLVDRIARSMLMSLGIYLLAYKYLTGKWPTQDPRFKMWKIPVGGNGHGPIDKMRHSAVGNLRWGKGPEVGYVNLGSLVAPLIQRVTPSTAIERYVKHGSAEQVWNAAKSDIANAFLHPAMGPLARALFVGVTGREPYITDFSDDQGKPIPQLFPALPKLIKSGFVGGLAPSLSQKHAGKHPDFGGRTGAQLAAALRELSSTLSVVGQETGTLGEDEKTGSLIFRTVTDLAVPGFLGNATNPYAQENYLMKQKRALAAH